MLVEKSGISFAEDALSSSYYTTASSSESTAIGSTESFTSTTTSISSTSSQKRGGLLTFLDWFKFGVSEEKKHDKDTVDEIIKSFVKNDVMGMEKFILPDISIHHPEDVDCVCCEEKVQPAKVEKSVPKPKATPHVNKILSQLPPKVRKAVRFELDYTPEEKTDRPFTPLYTSTPNQKEEDVDSDEDDLPPLREVDSNTLVNPLLNNTSSILLAHTSVMDSWNKSREETDNALRIANSNKNSYKIYYDDTDEEEVVDNPSPVEETPRRTFVVSSELSSETKTLHEQSFDHELDTSTDSSVILGLDRIEDYIRALEDEIVTANRVKREQDVIRARGALRHAQVLQERIGLMQTVLAEMCANMEDTGAEGDHSNLSAVLEDSCWSAQLGLEDGSFDGHQL